MLRVLVGLGESTCEAVDEDTGQVFGAGHLGDFGALVVVKWGAVRMWLKGCRRVKRR